MHPSQKYKRNKEKTGSQMLNTIGLLNIKDQTRGLPLLHSLLQTSNHLPAPFYLNILGITESFEATDQSSNYTSITGYHWLGKPNHTIPNRRGVGFWIKSEIRHNVSVISPKDGNENILWIQYITLTEVYYFAISYVPPDDHKLAKTIMHTLHQNYLDLEHTGTPIIMGDLNVRAKNLTADTASNSYEPLLTDLLKNTGLAALTNPEQTLQGTHYTFNGPMGKLIPDYILSPTHLENPIFTDFKVHQTISCGSDHRLLTASLTNSSHNLSSIWGTPPSNHIEWSNENINIYKHESHKTLTKIPLTTPKSKQDITRLGRNITEALTEALSSISTQKKWAHTTPPNIKSLSMKQTKPT
jgi:hypothetical protein